MRYDGQVNGGELLVILRGINEVVSSLAKQMVEIVRAWVPF